MKKRIIMGWNLRRLFFLMLGIIVLVLSLLAKQGLVLTLDGFFAALALIGAGCASEECFGRMKRVH